MDYWTSNKLLKWHQILVLEEYERDKFKPFFDQLDTDDGRHISKE